MAASQAAAIVAPNRAKLLKPIYTTLDALKEFLVFTRSSRKLCLKEKILVRMGGLSI